MTWIDLTILTIVLACATIGLVRGLVREVTSFFAVLLAIVVAGQMYPQGVEMVRLVAVKHQVPPIIGFAAAFVVIYVALAILAFLIRRYLVRPLRLQWADRAGGMLFGLAKGSLLVVSLSLVLVGVGLQQSLIGSRLLPSALIGGRVLVLVLPPSLRGHLLGKLDDLERWRRPVQAPRASWSPMGPNSVAGESTQRQHIPGFRERVGDALAGSQSCLSWLSHAAGPSQQTIKGTRIKSEIVDQHPLLAIRWAWLEHAGRLEEENLGDEALGV